MWLYKNCIPIYLLDRGCNRLQYAQAIVMNCLAQINTIRLLCRTTFDQHYSCTRTDEINWAKKYRITHSRDRAPSLAFAYHSLWGKLYQDILLGMFKCTYLVCIPIWLCFKLWRCGGSITISQKCRLQEHGVSLCYKIRMLRCYQFSNKAPAVGRTIIQIKR